MAEILPFKPTICQCDEYKDLRQAMNRIMRIYRVPPVVTDDILLFIIADVMEDKL